ncbi:MAG: nucleotidyltransferase family protein [Flavobacteriales bacterium]
MSKRNFPFQLPAVSQQLFKVASRQHENEQADIEASAITPQFLKQAFLSHLSGFTFRNLGKIKQDIDPSLWKQLELQYVQILQGNLQFLNLHQKMVQLLEANDIPFAVLKGLDLLFRTYREEGIRHISDIDLLIRPQDLPAVTQLFKDNGFQCKQSIDKSAFHEKHFQLHAPLQATFQGLNIDVHILLFDTFLGFDFPTQTLLANRERIEWNNQHTWVLAASDAALFNLLHLYVHLDKGNHFKMSSFLDVQRTIEALDYPKNKANYPKQIQVKIDYVIDCMVWLGLLDDTYLPQRKKAPARYFFYLLFFLQEISPSKWQTLRYKFIPRLFLYQFSWKTVPLLFHEAFPSKRYLQYSAPNSSYLGAWLKRLQHFTRKK